MPKDTPKQMSNRVFRYELFDISQKIFDISDDKFMIFGYLGMKNICLKDGLVIFHMEYVHSMYREREREISNTSSF